MLEHERQYIYLDDQLAGNLTGDLPCDTEAAEAGPALLRVLVVDDEKLIADTSAEILQRAGFHARTAYNGWAALDMVASFQRYYLLTDVLMPGLNGVQLAIAVSKRKPGTRVVLFSGQAG